MGVVSSLFDKLGYGSGDLLSNIRKLNDEFSEELPQWIDKASDFLVPVWKDFLDIMGDVKSNALDVGTAFVNFVGVLSGDTSIQGTTVNLDNMAVALGHVAKEMTHIFDVGSKIVSTTSETVGTFGAFGNYLAKRNEQKMNRTLADIAGDHGNKDAQAFYNAQETDYEQAGVDQAWNQYIKASRAN